MSFTVLWTPVAEQRLAAIWSDAGDRNLVTQVASIIDQTLRTDPEEAGESRSEGQRILLEAPLGVLFTVSPDDRKVFVLTCWRVSPRR